MSEQDQEQTPPLQRQSRTGAERDYWSFFGNGKQLGAWFCFKIKTTENKDVLSERRKKSSTFENLILQTLLQFLVLLNQSKQDQIAKSESITALRYIIL